MSNASTPTRPKSCNDCAVSTKLPTGWRTARLGDVCCIVPGFAFSSKDWRTEGIPVIKIKNIQSDCTVDLTETDFVPASLLTPKLDKFVLKDGDVLIAMTGATAGKVGKLRTNGALLLNQRVAKIEAFAADRDYIWSVVSSHEYQSRFFYLADGAAQPNMSGGQIEGIEIPLPPPATQTVIGAILSAYDDLIENNTRRIQILERMAQALYREWFVNFRFPGHTKVKHVASPLGPIPQGWETKKLRDICERVDYGYTASANREPVGPKFLRITDIVPSMIDWPAVPYCELDGDDVEKYRLEAGDIVVARTGATTGYAKRLNKRHPESVFASYLVRLRVRRPNSSHVFGLRVESDDYKQFIKTNLSGSAQPQANAQVLTSLPIVTPPPQLQAAFTRIVEPMLDQKEILEVKNVNLCRTCDLLLPKVISGALDVSKLEIETGSTSP